MKSNSQPVFYLSAYPQNHASQITQTQTKSPYLKAILSGTARLSNHEKNSSDANPDRIAALRYIKESALLKK